MGVLLPTLSLSSHLSHPDPPSTQEVLHLSHSPLSQPLRQTLLPGPHKKKKTVERTVGVFHLFIFLKKKKKKQIAFKTQNNLLWDFQRLAIIQYVNTRNVVLLQFKLINRDPEIRNINPDVRRAFPLALSYIIFLVLLRYQKAGSPPCKSEAVQHFQDVSVWHSVGMVLPGILPR